jgi:glycosyltransferase involved in cell wall biosynthesis
MISIIIPTRNRGEAFKRSLNSALEQTIECEIIVSDHASTDGTREHVESLNDPRIFYHQWDDSINITWNWILGFMESRGEWVKYLFDDDYLEPECCDVLLGSTTPETTVAQCGATFAWTGQAVYNTYNPGDPIPHAVRTGVLSVSPVTALIRRDALTYAWGLMGRLSQKAFDSGVGPNVLINYATLASNPERMSYVPEVLCHLDDLPGEHKSLTARLRAEDPDTLYGCHEESYRLLEAL